MPALTVRRANSTLELKPGDTFVMAGLYSRDYQNNARQVPFAGDIPVLGTLFRSARWRKAETELVIIVTPRLATPEDHQARIDDLPGAEPSTAELMLLGKTEHKAKAKPQAQPAGK